MESSLTRIRFCRWLLLSLDRLYSKQLVMTHELVANMLGVRRPGKTWAANKLQKAGVIKYERGHITVLNRPKLETLSCECYAVLKKEIAFGKHPTQSSEQPSKEYGGKSRAATRPSLRTGAGRREKLQQLRFESAACMA
jgi:hypothetical protein